MKEYTFGDEVKAIGEYAFNYSSSVTKIVMGKHLDRIRDHAFSGCGNRLEEIWINTPEPPITTPLSFSENAYNAILYVPDGAEMQYKEDKVWNRFVHIRSFVHVPTEVYTEFDEATGTLTYYYDSKMASRTGITELYIPGSIRFTGYYKKVLKAVIDPSMKKAPITSMRGMFEGGFNSETFKIQDLKKMTSIVGLENLNTSIVTDMNSMFSGCESLTELDLSSFDTKNVTNFAYMFMSCTGLQIVDVNSFDISNATVMQGMFGSCWELTTICCSNDWSNCQADTYIMFSGCKKLVGDKGTVFDNNTLDKTYARPDGGTDAPGYFTADTMTGIKHLPFTIYDSPNTINNSGEGEIYNLAGQMVNGKLQKGLYIINGKKMMVK